MIADPADTPPRGTTFVDAELTAKAPPTLVMIKMRPVLDAAAGSVIVLDEPRLEMMNVTPAATV
jgi:hypothetical protein